MPGQYRALSSDFSGKVGCWLEGSMDLIRKLFCALAIAAIAIIIDQTSKAAALEYLSQAPGQLDVTPFLTLRLGFNTGISFGLFQSTFAAWPWLLIAIQLGVVVVMIWFAMAAQSDYDSAAFSLIAGGAVGNILDRSRDGAVTDFLDLHWRGWHWPTFNLADVAICLGVALLLATTIRPASAASVSSSQPPDGAKQ